MNVSDGSTFVHWHESELLDAEVLGQPPVKAEVHHRRTALRMVQYVEV